MPTILLALAIIAVRLPFLWRDRHDRTWRWWLGWSVPLLALVAMAVGFATDAVARKALAHVLMPTGLIWLTLMAATAAAWWARRWRWAGALTALSIAYTLAGNPLVGTALMAALERRVAEGDLHLVEPFDAVCVLGGGTDVGAGGLGQLSTGGDRLMVAATLFHLEKTPLVVCSGVSIAGMDPLRDLGREAADVLVRSCRVPPTAIEIPRREGRAGPTNTAEEILLYRQLIAERGWKRVALVSSAWHLPRALHLCHRHGVEMVPIGADRRGRWPGWSWAWVVPQEYGFWKVNRACWEYVGMLAGG